MRGDREKERIEWKGGRGEWEEWGGGIGGVGWERRGTREEGRGKEQREEGGAESKGKWPRLKAGETGKVFYHNLLTNESRLG